MTKNLIYKYNNFRDEFPVFTYESFNIELSETDIQISYHFNLSGKYDFHPSLHIPIKSFFQKENITIQNIETLVFHIGMVELVSYWKASCSPKVIIKPFKLSPEQILWWKHLYFHGLGEFFYLNGIEADITDFMQIECLTQKEFSKTQPTLSDKYIVAVGGGKDSVVTLELTKELDAIPLIMNPREATKDTVIQAGYHPDYFIEINRSIHPVLLELNKKGFLNGHTPFSSLLAFVTALSSVLTGRKHILLSNESSANEATVVNTNINHQYSKSFEFESNFREYISSYISDEINYLSFLRPLNELQIVKLFSGLEEHHFTFRSCNAGSKTDTWCGKCPKCLFTYIMLGVFIDRQKMVKIFGTDLFNDPDLIGHLNELTGIAETKPFECVGTPEEVHIALQKIISKSETDPNAVLLKHYQNSFPEKKHDQNQYHEILSRIESDHFLPDHLLKIIKKTLHD
ncbi:MAG: hypothetical protein JEZ03_03470 [Bacteroidales bacterium]|nr:hypothetical protein [Bacteroidales bacterium]